MNDQQPTPGMGDNIPDYGAEVSGRLQSEFAQLEAAVTKALDEAREIPKEITDDDVNAKTGAIIIRLRDLARQILTYHRTEKEPYLRSGEAVDSFFFGLHDKLSRRRKTDRAGAADILQARSDAYAQAKLLEERRRREQIEAEARERERLLREERERLQREADEAAAKAARARKAANKSAAEAEAAAAEAEKRRLEQEETQARIERQQAQAQVEAKPADMMRQRTEQGHMQSMRQEGHVEVLDRNKLPQDDIWPFLTDAAILAAVKSYAKVTNYKKPIAGAIIEMRDVSQWR